MCGPDKAIRPIDRDPNGLYRSECAGSFSPLHPGLPTFVAVIENAEDLIWRDEDMVTVQEETDELILVDNAA